MKVFSHKEISWSCGAPWSNGYGICFITSRRQVTKDRIPKKSRKCINGCSVFRVIKIFKKYMKKISWSKDYKGFYLRQKLLWVFSHQRSQTDYIMCVNILDLTGFLLTTYIFTVFCLPIKLSNLIKKQTWLIN